MEATETKTSTTDCEQEWRAGYKAGHAAGVALANRNGTATTALIAAGEQAIPWLVLLGNHIGNGTPADPLGRCNAIALLKDAIDTARPA